MLTKALKKFFETYLLTMRRWEKKHPVLNAFIVLLGVVLLWRGVWGIMDTILFPDNPTLSYGVSILLGVIVLLLDDFEINEI